MTQTVKALYVTYRFRIGVTYGNGRTVIHFPLGTPERLAFPTIEEIEKQILDSLQKEDKRACDVFLTFWQWLEDREFPD